MEITGRLTRDAKVATLKDKRQVVNFSIAVNDYFKTKSGEQRTLTQYVDCAYWITPKVAPLLTRGTLVELFGRMSASAWTNSEGEARAYLNFHTSNIKILGGGKVAPKDAPTDASGEGATEDDLPF